MLSLLVTIAAAGEPEPMRPAAGEFNDTAYTLGQGRLAIHPLAEPWHWGATPFLDARFSVQSALYPGPEARIEVAPVQGRRGALSFEGIGRYRWSAGFEAALRVAADRGDALPEASTRFLDTMTSDLSGSGYAEGILVVRGSALPTDAVGVHANVGLGVGRIERSLVWQVPSDLIVDGRVGARTVLRGGVAADLVTLPTAAPSWSVEARWAHAWDRFRLEVGASIVTGWPAEASVGFVEQVTEWNLLDLKVFPNPTLKAWWRF